MMAVQEVTDVLFAVDATVKLYDIYSTNLLKNPQSTGDNISCSSLL